VLFLPTIIGMDISHTEQVFLFGHLGQ